MSHLDDKEWLPDAALDALQCERAVQSDLTDEELARKILMTAAPMAAQSVAYLSVHASAENIRLAASRYIIDGVVGGGFKTGGAGDDILLALVTRLQANDPVDSTKL
jgi:hypothetical protein